ncbi:GGDEF domain-containing protein [Demequina mangrovi]|nr:GGDEF domain-containing protein [Demequina mangrovi]
MLVSGTLLVRSFLGLFLRTRSRYAGWWMALLVLAGASSVVDLLSAVTGHAVAVGLGNGLGAATAACAWGAARALDHARTGWLHIASGPAVAVAATVLTAPSLGTGAGAVVTLATMAALFTLAAIRLWRTRFAPSGAGAHGASTHGTVAVTGLAVAVSILALFYVWRVGALVALGPSSPVYLDYAGASANALVVLVLLVVATFTMSELGQVERMIELRIKATRDALTGLHNRAELDRRARVRLAARQGPVAVVVADLDRFKHLNDTHGHAAGDRALQAFAGAVRRGLGPRDLAGRLGGEEFAFVLDVAGPDDAAARLESVRRACARLRVADGAHPLTASYGIAMRAPGESFEEAMRRADAAMYRAKRAGRDRIVLHRDEATADDVATADPAGEASAAAPAA